MANWIRMLSPVREESQNLFFVEVHRPFETLEFRAPYRTRGVQSFGDKWAFRRITNAPCREGVLSSNEKSVTLLGLIAAQTRAENMRRRSRWRSERDSNARYRTLGSTSPRKLDATFRVATKEPYSLVLARRNGFELGTMSALAGRR
jgi:hypothetical protein